MTATREELLELAEELQFCADEDGTFLNAGYCGIAAKALRLSSSPQPGYAAGLEAAARVAEGVAATFDFEYASERCDDISVGINSARLEIAAAIRALPLPEEPSVEPAVSVKPLEWREETSDHYWTAASELGRYHITHYRGMSKEGFKLEHGGWHTGWHDTFKEVKAAAQADFDQRIRSALVTAPAPALDREKVARLSDEAWTSIESYLNDECNLGSCGDIDDSARSNCSNVIANAIIALIEGGKSS